jgi:hypothetical protein
MKLTAIVLWLALGVLQSRPGRHRADGLPSMRRGRALAGVRVAGA